MTLLLGLEYATNVAERSERSVQATISEIIVRIHELMLGDTTLMVTDFTSAVSNCSEQVYNIILEHLKMYYEVCSQECDYSLCTKKLIL